MAFAIPTMADLKLMRPSQRIIAERRIELIGLLAQCYVKQRENFMLRYPGGVQQMTPTQVYSAIQLCERTIKANKARAAEVDSAHDYYKALTENPTT